MSVTFDMFGFSRSERGSPTKCQTVRVAGLKLPETTARINAHAYFHMSDAIGDHVEGLTFGHA